MILGHVIRYALEKALGIKEWENWSDSPFSFNGIPKDNNNIEQVIIYHDYQDIYIYTKKRVDYTVFNNLQAFAPFTIFSASSYEENEDKFRVEPKSKEGLVIKIHWY